MSESNRMRDAAVRTGLLVLLARIVDRRGAAIHPAGVSAIAYSIFVSNPDQTGQVTPIAGHEGVALDVHQVLSDSLRTGGQWSVDAVGYNFRHEIEIGRLFR